MGRSLRGILLAVGFCVCASMPWAHAAPTCTYNSATKTGTGCPENYKCSSRGVCEEAFTMAEIADAMKSPPAPYEAPPATREKCKTKEGWGIVGNSCLPTCEIYEKLWRETLKPAQQTEPGYSGCNSYLMIKPAGNCPVQNPLKLFDQKPIPAFGVRQGYVCCLKVCAGDPSPYNYSTHILPLFSGSEEPERSGPKVGTPTYPDGRPLPSYTPPPRPFTGPAPKKKRQ